MALHHFLLNGAADGVTQWHRSMVLFDGVLRWRGSMVLLDEDSRRRFSMA